MKAEIFIGVPLHAQSMVIKKARSQSGEYGKIMAILEENAGYYFLTKSRREEIVRYKHLLRYFLYWHTKASLQQVGYLSGCNHCTVINSLKVVTEMYKSYSPYRSFFDKIAQEIKDAGVYEVNKALQYKTYNKYRVAPLKNIIQFR